MQIYRQAKEKEKEQDGLDFEIRIQKEWWFDEKQQTWEDRIGALSNWQIMSWTMFWSAKQKRKRKLKMNNKESVECNGGKQLRACLKDAEERSTKVNAFGQLAIVHAASFQRRMRSESGRKHVQTRTDEARRHASYAPSPNPRNTTTRHAERAKRRVMVVT